MNYITICTRCHKYTDVGESILTTKCRNCGEKLIPEREVKIEYMSPDGKIAPDSEGVPVILIPGKWRLVNNSTGKEFAFDNNLWHMLNHPKSYIGKNKDNYNMIFAQRHYHLEKIDDELPLLSLN